MENNRGQWGSTFGFLMAAVGSAVGLGNIWGFPYKMGMSGGFAFLLVYLILVALVGIVAMLGELTLGRLTGKGTMGAYLHFSKKYAIVGFMGVFSGFLILSFYSVLGGMVMRYMVGFLLQLLGLDGFAAQGTGFFGFLLYDYGAQLFFYALFMVITMLIVMGGVAGGIEKFCSVGMPALAVMLVVIIIRSCTLPGAVEGLKFMFMPNFEPLKENFLGVLATAGGQMFFSLSLGMGVMITYGSYLDKKKDIAKNALVIICFDTLVALMAGLAVLPAAFALDPEGKIGGPSLLFVTLQNVFDNMGTIGAVFGIIFYLLVILAAVSSSISLLEVIVTHFCDKAAAKGKGDKRKAYSVIAALAASVLMVLVCLDGLGYSGYWVPGRVLVDGAWQYTAMYNDCWLDFFDMLSEGIMMPLGALLMCLMIGYEIGPDVVRDEIERNEGHKMKSYGFFKICVRFITPLLMAMVLIGQIKDFFL